MSSAKCVHFSDTRNSNVGRKGNGVSSWVGTGSMPGCELGGSLLLQYAALGEDSVVFRCFAGGPSWGMHFPRRTRRYSRPPCSESSPPKWVAFEIQPEVFQYKICRNQVEWQNGVDDSRRIVRASCAEPSGLTQGVGVVLRSRSCRYSRASPENFGTSQSVGNQYNFA